MDFITLFLMAIGLSMDAFAVSITKGMTVHRIGAKRAAVIGLFFGAAQGIMPVIGYYLGSIFSNYITAFDHWIAFILLGLIGGKMIKEAFEPEEIKKSHTDFCLKELFVLAIATSIDALAVGVSLAFIGDSILASASFIAITTFIISFIGVIIGKNFGALLKKQAEVFGGVILILIGIKILVEHLFFS